MRFKIKAKTVIINKFIFIDDQGMPCVICG